MISSRSSIEGEEYDDDSRVIGTMNPNLNNNNTNHQHPNMKSPTAAGDATNLGELELTHQLMSEDWPFHQLGEAMVSVRHPGQPALVYSEDLGEYYLDKVYRSPSNEGLRPHPYLVSSLAYLHLRRLGEDQGILFDGVRGAGKTEMYWEMFHHLSRASGGGKEEVGGHLQRVLDSFGTGLEGESKHGIYQEVQFSHRGKLVGVKTLSFFLDLSSGPFGFQVLRQFQEGVTDDERRRYRVDLGGASSTECMELMESLKQLGVKAKSRTKMRQVMGCMLLLRNAQFEADSDGAICHDLDEPAALLGLDGPKLLSHLNAREMLIGREKCTQLLTVPQAQSQLDEFLGFLYSLVYQHVIEKINLKLCSEDDPSFIAMLDFPGMDPFSSSGSAVGLEGFAKNYSAEMVRGHIVTLLTNPERILVEMDRDGLDGGYMPQIPTLVPLLRGDVTSLLHTLDIESPSQLKKSLGKNLSHFPGFRMDPTDGGNKFILNHYAAGQVAYDLNGFQDKNRNAMAGKWAQLLAQSSEFFVSDLVHMLVETKKKGSTVDLKKSMLMRHPSMKHRKEIPKSIAQPTVLNQLDSLLEEILSTMSQARQWAVLCLNASDPSSLLSQIRALNLTELGSRVGTGFTQHHDQPTFLERYQSVIPMGANLQTELDRLGLDVGSDFVLGNSKVFLSPRGFMLLEGARRNPDRNHLDNQSFYSERPLAQGLPEELPEEQMDLMSRGVQDDDEGLVEKEPIEKPNEKKKGSVVESASKVTPARRAWVRLTWMMTWWIPTCCIARCGRMTRPDVQMAWREKVTICLLILWSWIIILFTNIGLGLILCPANKVWKPKEIATLQGPTDLGVYMYGVVYDITSFAQQRHGKSINPAGVDPDTMLQFGGMDVTSSFPVPLSVTCPGLISDPNFKLWTNISDDTLSSSIFVHDSGPLTQYPASSLKDPNWFYSQALPQLRGMKKGEVVYDFTDLTAYRKAGYKQWGAINNRVYDLTSYVQTLQMPQYQVQVPGVTNPAFLPNTILQIFNTNSPATDADLTTLWNTKSGLSASEKASVMRCLDRQFFIGTVDLRNSLRCQVTNVMLLISSGMILLVTLVKFLAALQLTSRRTPTDYDKFVICQVPCYTEGEDSIRRTLESLALLNYDDKHKLIFVIADGMIIGSGNDRPTPRIVLDVLGVDPALDPEPFAFRSIGEGNKQLNYGKIYSGLFMVEGRSVPYIVAVKVGKENEGGRPGNRGKRDSQILLMNFLNRVHFDAPMSPLDLEMYHQLKNVIGVDPKLYEYVLMVDADTEVLSDSLTRLVAVMARDGKVIGLCGETQLVNENQSITTMMQVYEYYISHHLAKAFESLFGAVTCLPGCFCMYRIRTVRGRPLIISNDVIQDYSENVVDTLHKKNLLHLGEDRYLTTLMLKHFPSYKMKFTPDAQCKTVAPDQFAVLLSQRRRWINSTIHNLFELIFLNEMCGFCCFSMRFVVFLDLIGTLILPATVIYLIYIIVAASTGFQYISIISIIIMCSTYILQALIFILKQQWQHIGWMVFYLLGMGLFNFYIPIYSYWHFDDFSWGNTRVVVGDDGTRQVIAATETEAIEPFDPDCIPMVRWADHQANVWETASSIPSHHNHSQINPPFHPSAMTIPIPSYSRVPSPYQTLTPTHQLPYPLAMTPSQLTIPTSQTNLINTPSSTHPQTTYLDDQQLYSTLQTILHNSDLMTLTKKQIRVQLSTMYPNINWDMERNRVNSMVDTLLSQQQ